MSTIVIKGRTYTVETLPPHQLDGGRPVYRLTGALTNVRLNDKTGTLRVSA